MGVAPVVRKKVLHSHDRFWRPEDFDGSPAAVTKALARLTNAGELRRVRRGLYWRGETTRLGMAPPTPDRLIPEIVSGAGIGPAGWSAALALGLSTQVPRYEKVAVPGRAPRDPRAVRFVSRVASVARREERLQPMEVALLEVLREWDSLVELSRNDAIARIKSHVDEGTLRVDPIVQASVTEPPRVRERLRELLEAVGHAEKAKYVRPARNPIHNHGLRTAGWRS